MRHLSKITGAERFRRIQHKQLILDTGQIKPTLADLIFHFRGAIHRRHDAETPFVAMFRQEFIKTRHDPIHLLDTFLIQAAFYLDHHGPVQAAIGIYRAACGDYAQW